MEDMEHPAQREPQLAPVIAEAIEVAGVSRAEIAACINISEEALDRRLDGRGFFRVSELVAIGGMVGEKASALMGRAEAVT